MKVTYLDLMTTDPAHNLAVEEYVFEKLPRDRMYVMLWQNDNAVIIGKHQNTLAQVNLPYIQEKKIKVVRRLSGGGAVYHDMGNLNFTFIADAADKEQLNMKLFCQPIVRALAAVGIQAEVNGRNDITIDGRKFSGNSQYVKYGRVMHHGTILFRSDLDVVNHALQVDPEKIRSKGIQSVRSRVTNVSEYLREEIDLPTFRKLLLQQLMQENPGPLYTLTPEDLQAIQAIQKQRYDTWEWNFGTSGACTMLKKQRFEGCGTVEVSLNLNRGAVENAQIHGDFFSLEDPDALAQLLVGCRPDSDDYAHALSNVDVSRYIAGLQTNQFLQILQE
jgi:lipoate-protein ligase A